MPTSFPPNLIPPRRHSARPFRRPFNLDRNCVLALLPEINSTWIDQSLWINDATITSGTKVDYCRYGDGISFDGASDYLTVSDDASLDGMAALTISVWLYQTTHHKNGIVNKNAADGYLLQGWNNQVIYWQVDTTTSRINTTAGDYPLSEWYHLVAISTGTELIIYINGVEKARGDKTVTVPVDAKDVIIGKSSFDGSPFFFLGLIDEFLMFDRALAAWEVKALYEQGKP